MDITNGLTTKGARGCLCPSNKPFLLGLPSAFICVFSNIPQTDEDLSVLKLQNVALQQFFKSIFNNAKIVLTDKTWSFIICLIGFYRRVLGGKAEGLSLTLRVHIPYPLSSVGINTPTGSVLRLCQIQTMRFQNKIWILFWSKINQPWTIWKRLHFLG